MKTFLTAAMFLILAELLACLIWLSTQVDVFVYVTMTFVFTVLVIFLWQNIIEDEGGKK